MFKTPAPSFRSTPHRCQRRPSATRARRAPARGWGDPRAGGARVVESARQCWPGRDRPGSAGRRRLPSDGEALSRRAGAIVASSGLDLTGLLRPVREGNAFEETVERLLTVIKLGVVGPGERFPAERELAAQMGIRRLTLREAIRGVPAA